MSEGQNVEGEPEVVMSAAAVSAGGYTMFLADFADTTTAWQAYEALQEVEDGRHLKIEGVLVVNRDAEGEIMIQTATDHSTKRGLKWGVVGGALLGLVFPPSLLGSAAVAGAAGAAVGKGQQLKHRHDLRRDVEDAIAPGHSGLVALVSDPGAVEIRRALELADAIVESAVDDVVAKDIKSAAKAAKKSKKAEESLD